MRLLSCVLELVLLAPGRVIATRFSPTELMVNVPFSEPLSSKPNLRALLSVCKGFPNLSRPAFRVASCRSSLSIAWQEVREPISTGRPTAWSLNSEVVYLLLDTDGFRCLWGQDVDRATGHLTGSPFPARHLHRSVPGTAVSTSYGNSITAAGFSYEDVDLTGNLWRLVLH
jgi:hypothetical protein